MNPEASAELESAIALHGAGALDAAEQAYRRILAAEPQHAEAQHYLGLLLHQRQRSAQGIALILQGLATDGGTASRYNDLGNLLVETGDLDNALTAFRTSLELQGRDANVWNNFGSVLHRQRQLAQAEDAYRHALRHDPDFSAALQNLSVLLAETGREEEASLLACQAYIQPPLAGKPPRMLGIAYYRLGRIPDAAACYRAWLSVEPDNPIARHHFSACSGEAVPARASDEFVKTLFDGMADGFDEKLVGKLSYHGPAIVAALLRKQLVAGARLDILDGGCGTGLCAPVLAPHARRLVGVDLSPRMLDKARQCRLYDALIEAELTAYLRQRQAEFDLIVMADSLIYFGDLAELFAAVRQALRPNGMFAFTAEQAQESADKPIDFQLDASGRYRHSRRYVAQLLDATGFSVLHGDAAVLRSEFGKPVQGVGMLVQALPR